MRLTKEKAKASGKKGAGRPDLFCIENEYVTLQQMSDRVGVSEDAIRKRLAKLRKVEGAITWAKIQGE